jgi:hypothetical protein
MHPKMKLITCLSAILLMMPVTASAATFDQFFYNEYQTDGVYLFILNDSVDTDIHFDADPVAFGGTASGWSTTLYDPETLYMQGTTIDPFDGNFTITFTDNDGSTGTDVLDFTMEWAELLGGTVLAQGSLYYMDGNISSADPNFTSTIPTPVPASVWMLFSGLAFVIGIRRNSKKG